MWEMGSVGLLQLEGRFVGSLRLEWRTIMGVVDSIEVIVVAFTYGMSSCPSAKVESMFKGGWG